jgi:hypothetical protein
MLFQWIDPLTKEVQWDHYVRGGGSICGLTRRGKRPTEVVLTKEDLIGLLRNPDYAVKQVLCALENTAVNAEGG